MTQQEGLKSIQGLGCSPCFAVSSALSIFNGKKNRRNSMLNAKEDIKFQIELQKQKERYEDEKEAQEQAFKAWLKERQREFIRNETEKKFMVELEKTELTKFFCDWPLIMSIETMNKKRADQSASELMNIVVGRNATKDALSKSYEVMVDDIQTSLGKLGITKTNVYRFSNKATVYGGPALANIFAMMSSLPTIVILPAFIGGASQLSVSAGFWNQDALFPMQRRIFNIDVDRRRLNLDTEYKDQKIEEIKHSYVTIASVLNDSYLLLEGKATTPCYPHYAKDNLLPDKYPYMIDFAKSEYMSLLANADFIKELRGSVEWAKILDTINESYQQLTH